MILFRGVWPQRDCMISTSPLWYSTKNNFTFLLILIFDLQRKQLAAKQTNGYFNIYAEKLAYGESFRALKIQN